MTDIITDTTGSRMSHGSLPWVSNPTALLILHYLQVISPILLLALYVITFTVHSIVTARDDDDPTTAPEQLGPGGKPLPKKNIDKKGPRLAEAYDFSKPRKLLFEWVSLGVLATLAGNITVVIVHALVERGERWWCGQAPTIYLVGSFMVYALFLVTLIDSKPSPTFAHLVTWAVALIMEIIMIGASFGVYTQDHREPKVDDPTGGELQRDMTEWEIMEVTLDLVRIILLLALVSFYTLFVFLQGHKKTAQAGSAEERTSLLADGHGAENGNASGPPGSYGATNGAPNGATNGKPHGPHEAPAGWEKPKENPTRSWWEYIRAYAIFVPYIWPSKDRWLQVNFVVCIAIVLVQRGIQVLVPYQSGVITNALAGESGPVYMPWGAISLYILFRIFQGGNGLLGAARQVLWIPIEQYSYRELSVAAFEHVHMLSLEFHLGKKTGEVLSALGKGSSLNTFLESITFNVLPMLIDLGVAIIYFLIKFDAYYALVIGVVTFWYIYITIRMAAWRADIRRQATNASREEDALQGPLNFFGTFYRMIQNNMINSERMLELFKENATVVDSPDAVNLTSCEGEIRYNDVQFSYDARKPALQGLTFRCKPGTTTALVGESGGGKSTVFRLLFRFYNTQSGTMQIDGHDVQGLRIDSLRSHIGVVPQDTVLFNESLMYNLKYANQDATDEQIFAACRAASIHDKILGFPDGYDTKVGERGLRLSGGEKQRVAIARTIIKNPRIILLDEATAALDTETEEHIQEALQLLAKGRTMLVIAHRLSTITMCDQILVLHEGRVAERGTHAELLALRGGKYAGMWRKQVRAQKAADEARALKDKADRLRRESMDSSGRRPRGSGEGDRVSSSEDEEERVGEQGGVVEGVEGASKGVPVAQLATVLESDTGTDGLPQREALRSGMVRSPSPVLEEDLGAGGKPRGHP
ncbi:ATP-binding cassette-type vacuolar membrane transporter Hmt1 [Friedmanniomyces endolithicus]|uniref:ATP-binding cassette-type vacuolar membrane transporter Hmt1 n=1 Tax=Rachicladosporium monterosium TaxID=1507873 RepID=A0ABR0L7L0_9PEZI|nr:ATP-binding cassette-type vacuolar membrane transporter Hmt1 [Friedmanniomyces endolithicus]KAK5144719.1 ATP-binding cassette-type vacuolar membrane transporter Hmt1 [Rachicladosporium monterosium]